MIMGAMYILKLPDIHLVSVSYTHLSQNALKIKKTVEPVKEWVPIYKELYQVYLESYQSLKKQFRILAKIK